LARLGRRMISSGGMTDDYNSVSPKMTAHIRATLDHVAREEGADAEFKLKRYFYAIRPLLALQWIYERQSLPPMNLQRLMSGAQLPAEIGDAILGLLWRKLAEGGAMN